MADISSITLPNNESYNFKDAYARSQISALESYSDYLGVTSTVLTDGATTNPVTVNNESVTAVKGNIVNYESKEFIWNGSAWQEFGDMSAVGALGFKNSATGSFTPAGSVSGTAVTADNTTSATVNSITAVGTLPSMYVTGEVLSFSPGTLPTKGSDTTVLTGVGELSVTDPTFAGTAGTVTVS